jgi:hypothetical protein
MQLQKIWRGRLMARAMVIGEAVKGKHALDMGSE